MCSNFLEGGALIFQRGGALIFGRGCALILGGCLVLGDLQFSGGGVVKGGGLRGG